MVSQESDVLGRVHDLGGLHQSVEPHIGMQDRKFRIFVCEYKPTTMFRLRGLGLPVAEEVIILAVEAVDCLTLGAAMSPQVSSTVPQLVSMVRNMMPAPSRHTAHPAVRT
jgi:hypothetical protein